MHHHHLTSIQNCASEKKIFEIFAREHTWGSEGSEECSWIIGPENWALWMIFGADVLVPRIFTGIARASAQCAYGIKALGHVFYPE